MNSPRISILFWAILEMALGLGLFLVPAQITDLIGIVEPSEVWIRVLGIAVFGLGIFYLSSTFADSHWFYRASILERAVGAVTLAVLAIADGPWQLWIFAVATLLGGSWTAIAVRNSRRATKTPTGSGLGAVDVDMADPT